METTTKKRRGPKTKLPPAWAKLADAAGGVYMLCWELQTWPKNLGQWAKGERDWPEELKGALLDQCLARWPVTNRVELGLCPPSPSRRS